jgi:predicted transcriptional regulator
MAETILEMAIELIQAQIQAGQLSPGDMQNALESMHQSLMELKAREATGASPVETSPPPDWRKSISRHLVTCLECGRSFRQLSLRHLRQHDLNPRSYRVKYGIPRTQSLSAKATTARRREIAQTIQPWKRTPRALQAREEQAAMAKKGTRKKATRVEE